MDIVDRIQKLANASGLTIAALERATGLSNGIIKKWKTQSPSCDKIITLANYLNTTTEYLLLGKESQVYIPEDMEQLISFYKSLNEREKGIVLGKAETLAELAAERAEREQAAKGSEKCIALPSPSVSPAQAQEDFYIDICSLPASAGTGVFLDDVTAEPLKIVHTDIADRANYAVRVSGDSMNPEYCDGDIVLVETCPTVNIGEIGIFVVDGEGYIKQYGGDKLISLNPDYPNISLKNRESAFCRGRVLGIAEPIR